MQDDSYCIKLSGKAEIPTALKIGHNIKTVLDGSITTETIEDNNDGTKTHIYTFKPVLVEVIDETGERIRASDTRSRSQQLRAVFFRRWREENPAESFDEYYDRKMLELIQKEL